MHKLRSEGYAKEMVFIANQLTSEFDETLAEVEEALEESRAMRAEAEAQRIEEERMQEEHRKTELAIRAAREELLFEKWDGEKPGS